MAKDKVKPLKLEEPTGGTETNLFPTEADPSEDYTNVKGVVFENNDDRAMDLDGSGNVQTTDTRGTWKIPKTAADVGFDDSGDFDATDTQAAVEEIDFRSLIKDPTGFPNRTDSEFSFTDGSLTFTIQPSNGSFDYYIYGKKYTVSSADSVIIDDTEGTWFIYYNGDTLTASQTPWAFENNGTAFVSIVHWDATNNTGILLLDERHGLAMDWATHEYLHRTRGAKLEFKEMELELGNYTTRGDGSSDTHAQVSVSDGTFYDEDINIEITNSATPTDPFEQKLSTIAYIPLYYKSGSGVWRKIDADAFPVADDSGNTIQYNYYNPSTEQWSLENCTNDSYVCTWIFATNNVDEPVIGVVGQLNDTDVTVLFGEDYREVIEGFPGPEWVLLYQLLFKTNTSYTNTPKAALYDLRDLRVPPDTEDRYTFQANYVANAIVGRYLEIFPGVSSDDAPFYFPEDSFIRTITLQAAASSTVTIGFFEVSDLVNPVFSVSLSAEDEKTFHMAEFFDGGDKVAVKVTSGSILKPSMMVWVQTTFEQL